MMPRSLRLALTCLTAFTAALFPSLAPGQSLWIPRDRDRSVLVEALQPGLETIDEDFFTGVYFLDVRCAVGPRTFVVGEMPYSRFKGDFYFYIGTPGAAESTPGNLYLGIELHGSDSPIFGEFGVRLPTTSENSYPADYIGGLIDVTRSAAFVTNTVPILVAFNLRDVNGGRMTRLRVGASFFIPTDSALDPELFTLYSWQTGYEGRVVRLGGGVSGSLFLTGSNGNLGQRSVNQLELHGDFGAGRFRPGLELKLPLGSTANLVSVVLGVSLSARL